MSAYHQRIAQIGLVTFLLLIMQPAPSSHAETYEIEVKADTTKPKSPPISTGHDGIWTVDVTYDKDKKEVSYRIVKGPPGQQYWDGWIYKIPAVVKPDGTVTFSGPSSIPVDKDGKPARMNKSDGKPNPRGDTASNSDKVTFNEGVYDSKKTTLKSITNFGYTFNTTLTVKPPPKDAKDGKKATSTTPYDSGVKFDDSSQTLSITDSSIVAVTDLPDTLLGAHVTYPSFTLGGYNADAQAYMFINQNLADPLTISNSTTTFETSTLTSLIYSVPKDLFYGFPLDSSFNASGSPFIDYVSGQFDPTSPTYDQMALYIVEIKPNVNFNNLTGGFQISGSTGATDFHFVSVPEPGTFTLLGAGTLALLGYCRKRHRT
jgi:hypothetical protein